MKTSAPSRARRWWVIVPLAAACHFAVATGLLMVSYGSSLDAFERGVEAPFLGRAAGLLLSAFLFPLMPLAGRLFPGGTGVVSGSLLFAANSLLWGTAAWALIRVWRGRSAAGRVSGGGHVPDGPSRRLADPGGP